MSDQFTRDDVTTLLLEVMDWTYVQATRDRPMTDAEKKVIDDIRTALAAPCLEVTVDPRLTPDEAAAISSALAAPRPEPEPVAYFDLQKQVFFWAKPTMIDVPMTVALNPLPLYAAPPAAAPEPEPVRHPGHIIGNHWLETAYERICAGEAEADVLRDCGWERVDDAEALRRGAERYRWGVENARWIRHEHEAYVAIPVAVDADLSCTPMRTAAIDAAMQKGDKT